MNQIDFGGAVIPAMAGFFLFGKKAKVQEIQQDYVENLPAIIKTESPGLTGVTRYLQNVPVVTGVSKYLKKAEQQQLSGVAKYVLRQDISEKNTPKPSGVSQYISKLAKEPQPLKKTGVATYLSKRDRALSDMPKLTGVARYEAQQNLIERKNAALALVKKYREAEEEAARLAKEKAVESSYESAKAMIDNELVSAGEDLTPTTRVGRYLKQNAEAVSTRPTGVARYIAKQIIIESQKPKLNKVEKYLREQSLQQRKKAPQSGVAKYLAKLNIISKPKEIKAVSVIESRVSRYIAQQDAAEKAKPVLSGVSKYLENQERVALENKNKPKAIEFSPEPEIGESDVILEGEFIPASETKNIGDTGVSRYLEKQSSNVSESKDLASDTYKKVTGVSRYLEKQADSPKQNLTTAPLTGVDRYMLRKAS